MRAWSDSARAIPASVTLPTTDPFTVSTANLYGTAFGGVLDGVVDQDDSLADTGRDVGQLVLQNRSCQRHEASVCLHAPDFSAAKFDLATGWRRLTRMDTMIRIAAAYLAYLDQKG